MQQHNDWRGIYDKFAPIEQLAQKYPDDWNDAETLSTIGFACGKLAETSSIPREIFQDERRKRDFLKQQAKYRHETEILRTRCVKLSPDNPGYWSNLAYLYYLNAIELSQPKGRRDGDIREEIDKALEHFDEALSRDPKRITDYYRKGYLLAEVLPQQILFGKHREKIENRSALAREKTQEGIVAFSEAIRLWNELNPHDERQESKRKRYRKEYIKSLYHAGCSYYQLISRDWDEAVYVLDLRTGIADNDVVGYVPKDLEYAHLAWDSFYNCWVHDRTDGVIAAEKISDTTAPTNGTMEGVYKLYWLGKVSFVQYWILSGYGQRDIPQALEHRENAEKYLLAALACKWSIEKQRQKKDFIAELLARVYISKDEYSKAVEVIRRHQSKFLDAYVAHTLATALMLLGKHDEAHKILADAIQNRGNKAIWTTYFLKGCSDLREGNLENARQAFQKADEEAKKQGKETLDTSLIAQAFVSYKSNKQQEAVEYLLQAIGINPYRISVQRCLQTWKKELE